MEKLDEDVEAVNLLRPLLLYYLLVIEIFWKEIEQEWLIRSLKSAVTCP